MADGLCNKRLTCTDCQCLPRLPFHMTLSPDCVKATPSSLGARDAATEALSEVKEMLQDAVLEVIALKKKLEDARTQNGEAEDRCTLLDQKRRYYKAECHLLEYELESLKSQQQTEAGAWQKEWKDVHNECEMLRTKIYALQAGTSVILHPEQEPLPGQSNLASPEAPGRQLTVYSGTYSFSVNTFQVMVNSIMFRLAGFSRSLTRALGQPIEIAEDAACGDGLLARLSDAKHAMYQRVSEILFKGFEDDCFTFPECLVPEVNRDKRRVIYFNQVGELGTVENEEQVMRNFQYLLKCVYTVSKTEPTRLGSRLCPSSCTKVGLCGCGRAAFMNFCRRELHRLARSFKPEHPFWNAAREEECKKEREEGSNNKWPKPPCSLFMKRLLSLLAYLWRAHLVFLTFEQPCRMFKVKRGCVFDPAYMASAYEDPTLTSPGVVESTIVPGFHIGEVVVRSQVYVRDCRREADTVSTEFPSTKRA